MARRHLTPRVILALSVLSASGACDNNTGPQSSPGVIAFTSDRGDDIQRYYMIPASGGEAKRLDLPDPVIIQPLAWSPDGSRIAFVARVPTPARQVHQIFVANANGSGIRQLTNAPDNDADWPAWSPDGRTIAYFDNGVGAWGINVVPADGSSAPRRLTATTRIPLSRPTWSPDGSRIAFGGRDDTPEAYGLFIVGADGAALVRVLTNDFIRNPAWSPDGSSIAFIDDFGDAVTSSGRRLAVVAPDGTGRRYLTPAEGFVEWPSWSPDGRSLVFQRNVETNSHLFVMNVATGQSRQLTDGPQLDQRPSWGRAAAP
jgi:Tol biopolymer transport system component